MGGYAGAIRAADHGLQPLQPMAEGGRLGSPYGRNHKGLRWRRPDDRYLHRPRPPAGGDGKKGGVDRCLGRSRGGLTTKLHALVDAQGRPILIKLTAGQASDIASAKDLIGHLAPGSMLLADKGYDANELRMAVADRKAWANIPPKCNRKDPICFSKHLYKARNLVERFFNKIKQFRRIATRFDKTAENFLAAVKLVSVRIWLRGNESTA
jgi:transposase